MSQPVPREPTATPTPKRDNRPGGLPMWGWVAIAAAGGVLVLLWWRNRQSSATTTPTTGTTGATSGNDIASELSVLQTEIQNLQGQPSQPVNTSQPTSNVKGGWHVYNYLNDLQKQYPGISLDNLLSWNPGLNNNIDYSKPNDPTFKSDTTIRVLTPQITTSAQTGH